MCLQKTRCLRVIPEIVCPRSVVNPRRHVPLPLYKSLHFPSAKGVIFSRGGGLDFASPKRVGLMKVGSMILRRIRKIL